MKHLAVFLHLLAASSADGFRPISGRSSRHPFLLHAKQKRVPKSWKQHFSALALATLAWRSPLTAQAAAKRVAPSVKTKETRSVATKYYAPIVTAGTAGVLVGRRVLERMKTSPDTELDDVMETAGENNNTAIEGSADLSIARDIVKRELARMKDAKSKIDLNKRANTLEPPKKVPAPTTTDDLLLSNPSKARHLSSYLDQLNTNQPIMKKGIPAAGYLDSLQTLDHDETVVVMDAPLVAPAVVVAPIAIDESIVFSDEAIVELEPDEPMVVKQNRPVDSPEEMALKAKYAAIENIGERTYAVLVDLGLAGKEDYYDDDE